jgi:hypothetical protein
MEIGCQMAPFHIAMSAVLIASVICLAIGLRGGISEVVAASVLIGYWFTAVAVIVGIRTIVVSIIRRSSPGVGAYLKRSWLAVVNGVASGLFYGVVVAQGHMTANAFAVESSTPAERIVRSITLKAPISREEAVAIAEVYFTDHISGCGFARLPEDHGDTWKMTPLIGYAAQPSPNQIEVDKRTGAVSWKGGPSFASPTKLLKNEP